MTDRPAQATGLLSAYAAALRESDPKTSDEFRQRAQAYLRYARMSDADADPDLAAAFRFKAYALFREAALVEAKTAMGERARISPGSLH